MVGCHKGPNLCSQISIPIREASWPPRGRGCVCVRAIHPGVLSIISKLTIPGMRLDKSTQGLTEVIFTKASHSFEGSRDLFLCMKITVRSLAGRQGGDPNSRGYHSQNFVTGAFSTSPVSLNGSSCLPPPIPTPLSSICRGREPP